LDSGEQNLAKKAFLHDEADGGAWWDGRIGAMIRRNGALSYDWIV
jgi:hypothetical protein